MDNTPSPTSEFKDSIKLRQEVQASKKRSMVQKVVVTVKLGESDGNKKQKSEGAPSDCWSWRKYGQKPIKGSPHPRGYYRCSTSKGCSAKKQVERSRTDASVLIITYTSTHNHPGPATNFMEQTSKQSPPAAIAEDNPTTPVLEQEPQEMEHKTLKENDYEDTFHYSQSPFNTSEDIIINNPEDNLFSETTANYDNSSAFLLDGEPLSYPHLMDFSTPKSEENDFYDELEELPPTSYFTRNNFFKERASVNSI